uniref:AlNc14C351G10912 protein n=1 Tax=Albugo laibachii Nc14 TaxID=890382 RepID=F0WXG2_9STRA|nr:AlNc14C351G10912 [Albugo laibachii Nc14]|eukprot:CCA26154.1 AlNc14C351G10912 [Albugo laibachii Nc14]
MEYPGINLAPLAVSNTVVSTSHCGRISPVRIRACTFSNCGNRKLKCIVSKGNEWCNQRNSNLLLQSHTQIHNSLNCTSVWSTSGL